MTEDEMKNLYNRMMQKSIVTIITADGWRTVELERVTIDGERLTLKGEGATEGALHKS